MTKIIFTDIPWSGVINTIITEAREMFLASPVDSPTLAKIEDYVNSRIQKEMNEGNVSTTLHNSQGRWVQFIRFEVAQCSFLPHIIEVIPVYRHLDEA